MSSLSEACILDWNVERMVQWLREESLHDCVRPFSLKKINGLSFLNLSDCEIKALRISQESKRKLTKVLKKIKAKRTAVSKRFSGETSAIKERKKPNAIPAHVDHHDDDSDHDGWCTDDFSDDEEEGGEFSSDDSGGEYIEPEEEQTPGPPQGSPSKEVPNVPLGLVAQLRAGLNGTIPRGPCKGPPVHQNTKSTPLPFEDEEEQIYDEPPDGEEDEVYEQPSDDSGSAIVVHPMSHQKIIRCESDRGEYIDARPPTYSDQVGSVDVPPPRRPPKPGSLKGKKVPPPQPAPIEQEIYDEVPEDDELGRTKIVEPEQETYEVPDEGAQNNVTPQHEQPLSETYEVPDQPNDQETYEVPDQPDEPETYEVPEEPAPARPPPRKQPGGPGLRPLPKASPSQPEKMKTPQPKEVLKPKPAIKPMTTPKPQICPKPSTQAGPAGPPSRTPSRLYPAPKDNTVTPEPPSPKKPSVLPLRGSRPLIPPPSQESPKTEKNNNELPKNTPSPRIQPPVGRRPVPPPVEESPPPPPRPASIKHLPLKPPRLPSDSDNQDNIPNIPGRPLPATKQGSPLPAPPDQKSVDPLKQFPWFHGPLDKKVAETGLKSFSKEGAFIVRNSSKDPNNYSMSLFSKGSVKHLRMPRVNNKFVLGDSGKVQFSTIPELVDYYSQHQVELKSGSCTSLTAACPVKL